MLATLIDKISAYSYRINLITSLRVVVQSLVSADLVMLPGASRQLSALLLDQLPASLTAVLRDQQLVKLCAECRSFHGVCLKYVTSALPPLPHRYTDNDNDGEFVCYVCPSVSRR